MPVVTPVPYNVSANDWVEQTREHLLSGHVEEVDFLAVDIASTTATALQISDGIAQIRERTVIEIDLEQMYVRNVTGNVVTVRRGWNGTTAAPHLADVAVTANPRFPRGRIFTALNNTLRDMSSPGYFQMKTANLTFNPNVFTYDLGDSTAYEVYEVSYPLTPTSLTMWQTMVQGFDLQLDADPSLFPSGAALQFTQPPGVTAGQSIRVRYKSAFSMLGALTDDVSVTGIPNSGVDIPPLGAAIRLMAGRPVKRNYTEGQPETRRAVDVPPGAIENSMRPLQGLFAQRLADERRSLSAQWPTRKRLYGRSRWRF